MDNIVIIDNSLDRLELDELRERLKIKSFTYGDTSGRKEPINNKFFSK